MKKIKIVNLLVCSAALGPAFALAQSNVGVAGNRERGLLYFRYSLVFDVSISKFHHFCEGPL